MDNCGGAAAGGRAQIAVATARELEVAAKSRWRGCQSGTKRVNGIVY
jgi:hypothetical protein